MWFYQPIPSLVEEAAGPTTHAGSVELVGAGIISGGFSATLRPLLSLMGEGVVVVNSTLIRPAGDVDNFHSIFQTMFDSFIESID